MNLVPVVDVEDRRLDDYRRLTEPRYRRQVETAEPPGFLIAEGPEVVRRLVRSGLEMRSLLLTPAMVERFGSELDTVTCPVFVADRDAMGVVVGFDLHRGVVAAALRPPVRSVVEVVGQPGPVVFLEGINDHENLGAVMRSAAALGIGGVVLDPTCCDPFYRRSVRVSMGAVFALPIARSDDWPGDLLHARSSGRRIVALAIGPDARPIDAVDRGGDVALLLGAEGPGLSQSVRSAADVEVAIPMARGMDSLNVGHAAAVAFHWFAHGLGTGPRH